MGSSSVALFYEVLERCLLKRAYRMHLPYRDLAIPSSLESNEIRNHHPLLYGALEHQIAEVLLLILKSKVFTKYLYMLPTYIYYEYSLSTNLPREYGYFFWVSNKNLAYPFLYKN